MMEYVLYAAIATVILYIISRNVFLLRHHEKGVVYRSGKPARSAKPGVSFTLPFIEEFKRLDSREQILEMGERDIVSSDGKVFRGNVVVSYKLDDPLKVKLFDKNALDYDISRTASLALDETSVKINATSFKDELEPLLRDELNHRIKSSGVRAISVKIHNLSAAPTKPQKKTTKSSQIIDLVLSRGEISLSDAANELRTSEKTLEKQIEKLAGRRSIYVQELASGKKIIRSKKQAEKSFTYSGEDTDEELLKVSGSIVGKKTG